MPSTFYRRADHLGHDFAYGPVVGLAPACAHNAVPVNTGHATAVLRRARAGAFRRARTLALVTLGLAAHGAALPYSLQELLRLPLERLLQLEISAPRGASGAAAPHAAPKARLPRG